MEQVNASSRRPSANESLISRNKASSKTEANNTSSRRPSVNARSTSRNKGSSKTEQNKASSRRPSVNTSLTSRNKGSSNTKQDNASSRKPSVKASTTSRNKGSSKMEEDNAPSRPPSISTSLTSRPKGSSKMELDNVLSRSPSSSLSLTSRSKGALAFLRTDKARLSTNKTPVPVPVAVVERQRKQMVNRRYTDCMMARKQSSKEIESKVRDDRDVVIKELNASRSKPQLEGEATALVPWPGFRYHKNGDIRVMNNKQKYRRLFALLKAGKSHKMSLPDMPLLSSSEPNFKKVSNKLSNGSLENLPSVTKGSLASQLNYDYLLSQFSTNISSNVSTPHILSRKTSSHHRERGDNERHSLDVSSGSTTSRRAVSFALTKPSSSDQYDHLEISTVPSNRNVAGSKLNLNCFYPAVKPVITSSVWCNADKELIRRADYIPKDRFNIKFGVSSKMLHKRKSDLDEHRAMEEERTRDNVKSIQRYLKLVDDFVAGSC